MKSKTKQTGLLLFCIIACLIFFGATNPKKNRQGLAKTLTSFRQLDGNQINCTISDEAEYCDSRRTSASGLEWPRGSGKTAIFTAGIWLAGIKADAQGRLNTINLRTAQVDYSVEYQRGPLLETFNTTTNDDAGPVARNGDNRYRLYKINKRDSLRNPPNPDYDEWPGDLGAPYVDVNNNGQWDAGIDKPKFWGDQQIWNIANDVNGAKHRALGATMPMGIELQTTYFCFNQAGPLGDMMFMRWKIINKSDASYDSVFLGMWCDPDLGDANDDVAGCDTNLSLGFIYNGDNDDGTPSGYGKTPPAAGFDFFQGPEVRGSSTDTALFEGKRIPGKRNLPASSLIIYLNGDPVIQDPPDGSPDYALQVYDYLQGKAGTIHQAVIDPVTQQPIKFWFSGDPSLPASPTNQLPSNFPLKPIPPDDLRIMTSTGPFTLAKGDTQEIVGGFLIAQDADRLASVKKLKKVDAVAQIAFNDNFVVPSAPPIPPIRVSEMEDRIILDWSANITPTESHNLKGYTFQGYGLYQADDPTKPENWKRLALWDKVDGITTIEDYQADPVTGKQYMKALEYFTDSGLRYYYVLDRDVVGDAPLVNGKRYYFALTTFAVFTDTSQIQVGPKYLEAAKDPIGGQSGRSYVTTKGTPIGTIFSAQNGATIPHDRVGDDNVQLTVVSKEVLRNATYELSLNGPLGDTATTGWNIVRLPSDTLFKNIRTFGPVQANRIADGFSPMVQKLVPGPRRDNQTPTGVAYDPATVQWFRSGRTGMDAGGVVSWPTSGNFNGKLTSVKPWDLKKVQIRFGATQKAWRYAANVVKKVGFKWVPVPPLDSSFAPFIKRTPGKQCYYVYQDIVDVPFTAWEIDPNDGNAASRQLNVAFVERNDTLKLADGTYAGMGNLDGKWMPTTYNATDLMNPIGGGEEILYIFASDYCAETNPAKYIDSRKTVGDTLDLNIEQDSLDIMYVLQPRANSRTATYHSGETYTITPNYMPLAGVTKYRFTTTAIKTDDPDQMKADLDKINVFPNPYFGHSKTQPAVLNRFVTFNHLPKKAKIRIFTLNGELVRTLLHEDAVSTQANSYERWDMRNENGLPVASGMYIVHIEIEGVGNRILKLAIIQPEERVTRI
jgi:hypothetical protein